MIILNTSNGFLTNDTESVIPNEFPELFAELIAAIFNVDNFVEFSRKIRSIEYAFAKRLRSSKIFSFQKRREEHVPGNRTQFIDFSINRVPYTRSIFFS